jgi:hypothetical protein
VTIQINNFGGKMNSITVKTKEALKKAKNENYEQTIVIGAFANKVKRAKKVELLAPAALAGLLAVLGISVAIAPETGGASFYAAAVAGAALTGVEITSIIASASVGIILIVAVFKGYEEISFESGKLVLLKKQKSI